jgi:hypothetical protein
VRGHGKASWACLPRRSTCSDKFFSATRRANGGHVVTGASAGLGSRDSTGLRTQRRRANRFIARGREGLEGAQRDVESVGGQELILQADLADAGAVEAAAERVETELGLLRGGSAMPPRTLFIVDTLNMVPFGSCRHTSQHK